MSVITTDDNVREFPRRPHHRPVLGFTADELEQWSKEYLTVLGGHTNHDDDVYDQLLMSSFIAWVKARKLTKRRKGAKH